MEIKIKLDELKQILMESYKKGWHGSLDLNEENADSIIERYSSNTKIEQLTIENWINTSNSWNDIYTTDGIIQTRVDPADRSTWTFSVGGQ